MSWVLVAVLAAAPGGLELRGGSLEVNEGDVVQRLSLRGLTRDGWSCTPSLEGRSTVGPRVVHARACGGTETYTTVAAGLEHELVLATRPAGRGPLRVRLEVEGGWLGVEGGAQRFGGPGLEGWRYGAASLVRREGLVPLETRRVPGGLELLIPEAELARPDAFPLHIDPLVTRGPLLPLDVNSEVTPSAGDEFAPAVAFSLDGTAFLALWSDTRRSTNRFIAPEPDIYGALINPLDGGRLELVTNDPGIQDRAVVSAVDGGFVVAWEDKHLGSRVRLGFVSLAPDAGALVLTPTESAMGSKPALSPLSPAHGVVFAWVPSGMLQTVNRRSIGGSSLPPLDMRFNVAQVSVVVVGSDVWVAATDGISQSKVFKNQSLITDQLNGDQIEVAFDTSRLYVLVKNQTPGSGVTVFEYDLVQSAFKSPFSLSGSLAMAWTTYAGNCHIGTLSANTISVSSHPFTAVSNIAMVPATTPATAQELALAGSLDELVVAYTVGRVGDRDLLWERVPSSNGTRSPRRPVAQTSASLRRNARVDFRGNRGLAVWLSNRQVRGRWLTDPADGGEIAADQVFVLATESRAIGAVDLAFRNDGSAVVVWSVLDVAGSQLVSQTFALDSRVPTDTTFVATTTFVTALDVESAGSLVYVAWKDGSAIRVREAMTGTATSLFSSTVPLTATFDLSCSPQSGGCVGVVENGQTVRATTFPNTMTVSLGGSGPVAALMSDDQALIAFRNATNLEIVDLAAPTVVLDSVPLTSLEVRNFILAGSPRVLAATDYGTTPPTVRLAAEGEKAFTLAVSASWNPDVAMGPGGQGVVVVTQDDLSAASTLVAAQGFQVRLDAGIDGGVDGGIDAGVPDAGPPDADAGSVDAGRDDAGVEMDAGVPDGGVPVDTFVASGCACDALGGAWVTWLVLVWAVRRRLIN
jgi:hypothetical protein